MIDLNYELYLAVSNGDIIRVKLMLKLGADVNAENNYALRWAAAYGHKDLCELLIEHGADVNNALKAIKQYYDKDIIARVENILNEITGNK